MLDGLLYGRTNGALVLVALDGDGGGVQELEAAIDIVPEQY